MTREDLYAHYKRYYMTNNASLVIVGDFDTAELQEKIHAAFDALPAGPEPAPLQIEEQPQTGERRVTVHRPGPTHYVMLAYHAPEGFDPGSYPDEYGGLPGIANYLFYPQPPAAVATTTLT